MTKEEQVAQIAEKCAEIWYSTDHPMTWTEMAEAIIPLVEAEVREEIIKFLLLSHTNVLDVQKIADGSYKQELEEVRSAQS